MIVAGRQHVTGVIIVSTGRIPEMPVTAARILPISRPIHIEVGHLVIVVLEVHNDSEAYGSEMRLADLILRLLLYSL
jgi:hypothetical protein